MEVKLTRKIANPISIHGQADSFSATEITWCAYRDGLSRRTGGDALLRPAAGENHCVGTTREQAIGRLVVALRFHCQGVSTNAQLLLSILQDDLFVQGQVDTGMVARILAQQNVH